MTATDSKDVMVDTRENVGLACDVLSALHSQLHVSSRDQFRLGPQGRKGQGGCPRPSKASGILGHWRSLAVDWVDGPELADIHVRP